MLPKKLHLAPSENSENDHKQDETSKQMLKIEHDLCDKLNGLKFAEPVCYVYNPLVYANKPHTSFINKFCKGEKKILFLGLNPGPDGMCQTGIPFGEVNSVINWFGINETIDKPGVECEERPVLGFACTKSEPSGKRFWDLFQNLCGKPENFFKHAFIYNYCPLAFMKENGDNITPADMKVFSI